MNTTKDNKATAILALGLMDVEGNGDETELKKRSLEPLAY